MWRGPQVVRGLGCKRLGIVVRGLQRGRRSGGGRLVSVDEQGDAMAVSEGQERVLDE